MLGFLPRLALAAGANPSTAAPAEIDVARMLTDGAALRGWLAHHDHELAAARARVDGARSEVGAARLFQNPVLDAGLANVPLGKTNPPGLGWGQTVVYSVGVSQTFELGKRGPRTEAAELRVAAAEEVTLGGLAERIALARLALGRVVYLEARQRVLGERLASARDVNELERARVEQGALSGNDYDRLLLDTTALELEVSAARADYASALAMCRGAMLAPCRASTSPALLETAAPIPDLPASIATTMASPPEVRALKLESQAARADLTLAKRRAIPDPTLRLGYTRSQFTLSGDNANTLEIGLSLPMTIFDHGQADAARALARERELNHTAEAITSSTRAVVEGLVVQKAALERGVADLDSAALPRSKTVLDTTEKAFAQGQVDMTTLLLARRAHKALLLNLLDLRFELFAVRSQLRRALGLDIQSQKGAP
jgi:cobalt-zinc-cadmium efflux system outer membrane protein